MATKKSKPADVADPAARTRAELRRMAEEIDCENCAQTPELLAALSPEAAWQTLHELRVHQIELEIQNEELRRTQVELQSSRTRYFDLFDLAPVGYLTISDTGLILEANLTFSTWVGVPRKTMLQQLFSIFISPEDQDVYYLQRKAIFETGAPQVCELRLVNKGGSMLWMQAEMVLAQEPDGANGLRITLSDICRRKRVEAHSRQQTEVVRNLNERLSLATESAGIGVWDLDMVNDNLVWDDNMYKLYGVRRDTFTAAHDAWLHCIHPDDREASYRKSQQAIRGDADYDAEFRIIWPNGTIRYIKSFAKISRSEDGTPQRMTGVNYDITERKEAEEALFESESRYRTVLKQSPEAIILIEPETGEIVETNARFNERFGYNLLPSEPLTIFELIFDETDSIRAYMDKVLQTGSVPLQRRRFLHRNGSLVIVERSGALISFQGRRLLVMTVRDVSEEVRREQEIGRDAQQAIRVQKAMLSVPDPSDYLDIATIYQPFGYVGGDLYFLDWRYGGNLLRGFLVDATGHGLGTALHTASMHVLIREVNERDLPLSEAMRWLNLRAGAYFDEGTFAGALGFEIDLDIRQLRWTCAGIPKIMVSTQAQQCAVECPGMCLGIRENETFETHMLPIEIGDSFYFMTDGLTDLMQRMTNLPLNRHSAMLDLLCTLSESQERRDDATAVCIHVRALPQALVRQDGWPRTLRFNGYGDYQRLKGEVGKILAEVTGETHSIYEVSIHEALANAMECRDGVPRLHKARLRFNKVGNRFIVRVKTSRIGFAGNAILKRLRSHPEDMFSFGEDASMGRGIPIMLSLSHKMMYNSEGTEVLLAWKL
jgi:PAS domain S-box-containing protein